MVFVALSCLEDHGEYRVIVRIVAETEVIDQMVFVCNEFRRSKAMKNSFRVIARKRTNESVLLTARVLSSITLKEQLNCTEKEYDFLKYMKCPRTYDIDRELWCVCL